MDPETITIYQIIKALRPKHLLTIIGTIGSLAYGAYWIGQNITESKARAEALGLTNKITQLETEQRESNRKIAALLEKDGQWQQAYKKLQEKSNSISAKEPKTQINCDFINKQIQDTKDEMKIPTIAALFGASTSTAEAAAEEKYRKTVLEGRLSEYIKQLSSCDK